MRIQYQYIRKIMLPAIACLCLLIAPVPALWADTGKPVPEESARGDVPMSREKVTIVGKSSNAVSTRMGERYGISSATLIIGPDGEQQLIAYLLVPCEAYLVYETKPNGTRLVHRIEVLSIHNKATNQMRGKPQ